MYFNIPQPNSAAMMSQLEKYSEEVTRAKEEAERKKNQVMKNIEENIKVQRMNQDGMAVALFELVKIQNESNKIIKSQCDELKRQNDLLQEQNINQSKELKKQKKWNIIAYCITTAIAVASVVGTFLSIFLR